MGSWLSCFSDPPPRPQRRRVVAKRQSPPPPPPPHPGSSGRWVRTRSGRKEDSGLLTHEQALAAAAILLQHHRENGGVLEGSAATLPFDRSTSSRFPANKKKEALPRSSSTRPRSIADLVLQPQQLVNQEVKAADAETNKFVLVHGGGFGAWCWYKTIALLEDSGFKVYAIDLTGSGVHSFDSNNVSSLRQYGMPLITFLEKLAENEKVILVGHDFGGACISYAMEAFPSKVAKAVFLSATMMRNGQSTLDMFSQQAGASALMQQAQIFLYANGNGQPPTAIELDKALLKDLLFNQSPVKDVALASVSLRPIPFAPVLEKLSLTDENYGSVRRFFIETTEDNAIPLSLQESMCSSNPPEKVFRLKGSDHCPFFSKPQALHKFLVEIAHIPPIPNN